jgi:hypothetical protein
MAVAYCLTHEAGFYFEVHRPDATCVVDDGGARFTWDGRERKLVPMTEVQMLAYEIGKVAGHGEGLRDMLSFVIRRLYEKGVFKRRASSTSRTLRT